MHPATGSLEIVSRSSSNGTTNAESRQAVPSRPQLTSLSPAKKSISALSKASGSRPSSSSMLPSIPDFGVCSLDTQFTDIDRQLSGRLALRLGPSHNCSDTSRSKSKSRSRSRSRSRSGSRSRGWTGRNLVNIVLSQRDDLESGPIRVPRPASGDFHRLESIELPNLAVIDALEACSVSDERNLLVD